MKPLILLSFFFFIAQHSLAQENPVTLIKGVVLESSKDGNFLPLQGASVSWLGTAHGTFTDSSGVFIIGTESGVNSLIVSFTGYVPDTLIITDLTEIKIILATDKKLEEVVIRSKMHSTYISSLNPIRTQIMTEKELFKAACCNLSESFETNPSVDVSYNDAVTGSKQIQLLGLSGNYTQLTIENLPGPRGLATPLGLNSIAGPWIESIQLSKGIGSVANGFESMAGQINVELKKPGNEDKLLANLYMNSFGKTDINLNLSAKAGEKWSTLFLLHDDFLANTKLDMNGDGFRDLPSGNQFSAVNRWKFENGKGLISQFGFMYLNEQKTSGETAFDPEKDKFSTTHYGLGINTERYEIFTKLGYVFPNKKYKSIGLQLAAFDHEQDSYFGLTKYNGSQQNLYGNLIYQSIISSTTHKFRTGLSFLLDNYKEELNNSIYKRKEVVPGAFFEYTYTPGVKFSAVLGIRADNNNLFGFFVTPRVHLKYEPVTGTVIRVSAGRGQRTANIFAENIGALVSSRAMTILRTDPSKGYGLAPEVAWNKGIAVDQRIRLFGRESSLSFDYFRTDFSQQVIADMEKPREIRFYNLQGKSFSNSLQAQWNVEPVEKFEVRLAYRFLDVRTTYGNELLRRPLLSQSRAFINLAYARNTWKFDYTLNLNGRKRIPGTLDNPIEYRLDDYSPAFLVMNAQVSKTVGKKLPMEFYIGSENLGNFSQDKPILSVREPFSPYFDASLVWGPVEGRMIYAGWRFRLK